MTLDMLRRRKKLLASAAAVVAIVALVSSPVLLSASVRSYLYREMSFQLLADRIVGDDNASPEEITIRIAEYVEEGLYPGGGPALDTNAWNDLVRGIAWCDQHVWLMSTLLAKKNIPGRMVYLLDEGRHVIGEVLVEDEWRAIDPLYGFVFRRAEDHALPTVANLSEDPAIVFDNERMQALPVEARRKVAEFFSLMFPVATEPSRWSSLLEIRNASLPRRIVDRTIRLMLSTFGEWPAYRFQDLYLGLLPDRLVALDSSQPDSNMPVFHDKSEDPALFLYYKARNYHLYERGVRAEQLYEELLTRYPDSPYGEKGEFFLGSLSLQVHHDPAAAVDRLSRFLERNPDTGWSAPTHYLMGRAYEELGNVAMAERHYRLASSDPFVGAASRLSQLALQPGS